VSGGIMRLATGHGLNTACSKPNTIAQFDNARTTSSFVERAAVTAPAFGSSVQATLFLPSK
jgi:hypothetical protein